MTTPRAEMGPKTLAHVLAIRDRALVEAEAVLDQEDTGGHLHRVEYALRSAETAQKRLDMFAAKTR
jgi:hypothetical protein